jgi:nucleoside-triphosphatase THEP1
MITFVVGAIDSGKTSYLAMLFDEQGKGDGFLARKIYRGTKVSGYEAVRLSTKQSFAWLIQDDFYHNEFKKEGRVGPFHVDLERLAWMEANYEAMLKSTVTPIYLDEIGPWELSGQGFDPVFRKCVSKSCDVYVAVREDLLAEVIRVYDVKDYCVIRVQK